MRIRNLILYGIAALMIAIFVGATYLNSNNIKVSNIEIDTVNTTGGNITINKDLVVYDTLTAWNQGGDGWLAVRPGPSDDDANVVWQFRNGSTGFKILLDASLKRVIFYDQAASRDIGYMYLNNSGSLYLTGELSADTITDRTDAPSANVDVLAEAKLMTVDQSTCKGNVCEIDKSSLPAEMVKCEPSPETGIVECSRSLTYAVSHLQLQNQKLIQQIEDQNQKLIDMQAHIDEYFAIKEKYNITGEAEVIIQDELGHPE